MTTNKNLKKLNFKTIGERIRFVRKEKVYTLDKFASQISITKNYISKIENNKKSVSDQVIFAICHVFNVPEYWLRHGGKLEDIVKRLFAHYSDLAMNDAFRHVYSELGFIGEYLAEDIGLSVKEFEGVIYGKSGLTKKAAVKLVGKYGANCVIYGDGDQENDGDGVIVDFSRDYSELSLKDISPNELIYTKKLLTILKSEDQQNSLAVKTILDNLCPDTKPQKQKK